MLQLACILLSMATVAKSVCLTDPVSILKEIYSPIEFPCTGSRAKILDPRGDEVTIESSEENVYVMRNSRRDTTKLIIQSATLYDAGTYQCIAVSCANITIDIYALQFVNADSESRQTVQLRRQAVINCTISSQPVTANVEWSFNDNRIYDNSPHGVDKYINGTNLVIKRVSRDDEGIYTCKAVLRTYAESRDMTINVTVSEGDLRCAQCNHSMTDEPDEDPCTAGDADELGTVTCFSTCITVHGRGKRDDGTISYFVLRDCGDLLSESYEENRDLDQSQLAGIKELYGLDSSIIQSGMLRLCSADKCNTVKEADYITITPVPEEEPGSNGCINVSQIYPQHIYLSLLFLVTTYFI